MTAWSGSSRRQRMPTVIALIGQAGSGKTEIAKDLELNHHYVRVRFAGVLKSMLLALGLSMEEIDGSLKERPCSLLLGKTPRYAMQTLGTEWGRNLIHPDIWVHAWKVRVVKQLDLGHRVVCDDCRHENEVKFVRTFSGAEVWEVVRPGLTDMLHSSEKGLKHFEPDKVIYNHSTIESLKAKLEELVNQILAQGDA